MAEAKNLADRKNSGGKDLVEENLSGFAGGKFWRKDRRKFWRVCFFGCDRSLTKRLSNDYLMRTEIDDTAVTTPWYLFRRLICLRKPIEGSIF